MLGSSFIPFAVRFSLVGFSAAVVVLISIGCAPLNDSATATGSNGFSISRSSMNPGAVAVQLAVVQLDSDQRDMFEQYWSELDQMKLPLPVRKKADENGLRYAVMSPQVPIVLPQLLKRRELDLSQMDDLKRQMAEAGLLQSPSRMVSHQRIENDTGEEYEIITSDVYPQKRWSIADGGGVPLTGFGQLVRGVYRFSSFPQTDGSIRLLMLPEIHHGISKNRYDVSQRTFLLNESQIKTKVTPLEFAVDLKPGESLIIAPSGTSQGIGDLLFGHAGLIAGPAQTINQTSQLNHQIESALRDLDARVDVDADMSESQTDEKNVDGADVDGAAQPVTPLFRFLMIRMLHAEMGNAFEADSSERLTTVNHD